jgi:hypothetical protein
MAAAGRRGVGEYVVIFFVAVPAVVLGVGWSAVLLLERSDD